MSEPDGLQQTNCPGRYLFNIAASGPGQGLRPLRAPDEVEPDDEDEEA
ncbi:hypothetical protein [Streptomyces erythrochromogenes]|nr:hypothetical protein [Streptomyces erythrochromogenes]